MIKGTFFTSIIDKKPVNLPLRDGFVLIKSSSDELSSTIKSLRLWRRKKKEVALCLAGSTDEF